MALITTTVAPTPTLLPYTGLTQTVRERNNVGRAEVRFDVAGTTIPATGAGDQQRVFLSCALPRGYAYALLNATARIGGTDSDSWDFNAEAVFQDGIGANATQEIHHNLQNGYRAVLGATEAPNARAGGFNFIYEIVERVPAVLWNKNNSDSVRYFADFVTGDTNTSACSFSCALNFIQYDIEQAYDYRINTPTFVR